MKIREEFELKKMGKHFVVTGAGDHGSIAFALNETGAFLWDGIAGGLTEEQLFQRLCMEYEADASQEAVIREDVTAFLEQLRSMGVLEED